MGGAGALGAQAHGFAGIVHEVERDGSEAHETPVSGRVRVAAAGKGIPRPAEGLEGRSDRKAETEATAGAAQIAFVPPTEVAFHLVTGVEAPALDEALGKTEGHGGIVGPLSRAQVEGSAAHHVGDRGERPRQHELHGRAHGVARSQPEEGASEPTVAGGGHRQAAGHRPTSHSSM